MQTNVLPGTQPLWRAETEGFTSALCLDRQRLQHIRDFAGTEAAMKCDGAEMMAVQAAGELGEQRVLRIGRHTLDDELVARHAQGQGGALLEEMLGAARDPRGSGRQRRMPLRIHGVFMERDRELDEKVGQLSR